MSLDTVWIPEVGARGWAVLTADKRIRYRAAERLAVERAELAMFVLATRRNLTRADRAAAFVAARKAMRRLLREREPPFIAKVDAGGRLTHWWP